jgi:hypothetical protein
MIRSLLTWVILGASPLCLIVAGLDALRSSDTKDDGTDAGDIDHNS